MKSVCMGELGLQKLGHTKVVLSRISISVKFPCRLYLEYSCEGQHIRSRDIKIDPKEKNYLIEEEIKWEYRQAQQETPFLVYVKLISNKGISFTAGILSLSAKQLQTHSLPFKVNLAKALDPQSYCECRCISNTALHHSFSLDLLMETSCQFGMKGESVPNEELKIKVREMQLELQSVKAAYQLLKLRELKEEDSNDGNKDGKASAFELRKYKQMLEIARAKEKEYVSRIQTLQAEQIKAKVMFEKQKQIIKILQSSQRTGGEERAELRAQIRVSESDLEQKRKRIRELQGEKLNLMMGAVTTEKEVAFLKERVCESINKVYSVAMWLLKQKSQKSFCSVIPKFGSLSGSGWPREGEDSYKLSVPAHKYFSREREQLGWEEQSLTFKDSSRSGKSGMNDMSISNIKLKNKEEVSLLNSQMFVKGNQNVSKASLGQNFKSISDYIRSYSLKIERMLSNYFIKSQREITQLRQGCRGLQECNDQFQRNQQQLLNHLQELEGGLESQIEIAAEHNQALVASQQTNFLLQKQLTESNQMVRQLESAVSKLEQQREELKRELHQNNYAHAQRQEHLMAALTHAEVSPVHNLSLTPKVRSSKRLPTFHAQSDWNRHFHEQEMISYREQMRTLELELSHERKQCKSLRVALETAESERHKYEFAMRMRERMQSLNESIEISREESGEKGTQESLGFQEEEIERLLAQ